MGAGSAVPWELLRDPVTDGVLALRAGAFVRTTRDRCSGERADRPGGLRVLLVICRPGGREDVPFRSVASHLVRLSRGAREAFRLDVLRPPTFAELARVLEAAKKAGEPYQVVHFDGHGTWLDEETAAAGGAGRGVQPGDVLAGVAAAAGLARVPGVRGPRYAGGAAAGGRPGAGRAAGWCRGGGAGFECVPQRARGPGHAAGHGDRGRGMRTGGCGRTGRWPRR